MAGYFADAGGERVLVDGSWNLTIHVPDLDMERTIRVKGDTHIGYVMVTLVDRLDVEMDWSDHALWWPEKNKWLLRARSTLDQYNVQADAKLLFTTMHKNLKVQLPDLQVWDLRVNFSTKCFTAVVETCKELGIRHPEELSFLRKWDRDDLKRVIKETQKRNKRGAPDPNGGLTANDTHHNSSGSLDGGKLSPYPSRSPIGPSPTSTLVRSPNGHNLSSSMSHYSSFNGTIGSPGSMHSLSFEGCMESSLANSPPVPSKEAFRFLYRPRNHAEKAKINCAWLDSSTSLMEQGLRENDFIMLKFKYFNFYDINPKYDAIRINQIYEQAKWALISDEIDCTEEEMMVFAALQFQVQLASGMPQPDLDVSQNTTNPSEDDDIDAALKDLQETLEGTDLSSHGDITHIPELTDYIRVYKPKKFTLKRDKRYYASFKDTSISFYRSKEESSGPPVNKINVKCCEPQPDVNLAVQKYCIKLFVPEDDVMSEWNLRFEREDQYCSWMAALRLANKGKTMADSSYETEVQGIQTFLTMQHPVVSPSPNSTSDSFSLNQPSVQPEDFVASRFFKKIKSKQLVSRILDAHANLDKMSLIEAKLSYIRNWQSLPEYGITYFRIKMRNSKKEDLLGIATNRIIRMDVNSGESLKTWRYSSLKSWHVNWEVREVILDFEDDSAKFSSIECSCKVIHEFIGGYIFLSTRSGDKNQKLDEEMFHKLTGGWHE